MKKRIIFEGFVIFTVLAGLLSLVNIWFISSMNDIHMTEWEYFWSSRMNWLWQVSLGLVVMFVLLTRLDRLQRRWSFLIAGVLMLVQNLTGIISWLLALPIIWDGQLNPSILHFILYLSSYIIIGLGLILYKRKSLTKETYLTVFTSVILFNLVDLLFTITKFAISQGLEEVLLNLTLPFTVAVLATALYILRKYTINRKEIYGIAGMLILLTSMVQLIRLSPIIYNHLLRAGSIYTASNQRIFYLRLFLCALEIVLGAVIMRRNSIQINHEQDKAVS